MLQSFKKISWLVLLAFSLQTSWAFSLLGPTASYPGIPGTFGDDWQVTSIGFNGTGSTIDAQPDGPKNLGEAYRHNTPVMYYAVDANFLNFFGPEGSDAIDQAYAIINNSMTNNSKGNLDGYSSALTEFPLNSQTINYEASALNLLDLKSQTLSSMMEQLGLADPIRYAWVLHNRYQIPGSTVPCPANMVYEVVMRNFDVLPSPLNQLQYSPYVNASLYTYNIFEKCVAPDPLADAVESLVDPLNYNPPVSSYYYGDPSVGTFFTGLTRDDVGGLRYLYTTNAYARELPDTNSVLVSSSGPGGTNYGLPFVLFTSNYNAFAAIALTNSAATLTNLYPGLIITSSTYSFVAQKIPILVLTTNNLIGAPAGTQVLGIRTNGFTQTYVTQYKHTYANLIVPAGFSSTNKNTTGFILTTQVYPLAGAPAGTLGTNISLVPVTLSGVPSGDYYIATNVCGPDLILSNLFTIQNTTSSLIYSFTNALGWSISQSFISTVTTHALVAEPIVCAANTSGGSTTNAPGNYQGVGKVLFVKTSYDSLLGQFYQPITNTYTQYQLVNSKLLKQTFQRVVTTPDVRFSAADLLAGPNAVNNLVTVLARSISFDLSTIAPNPAGPGVITNPQIITFNKVGPVFLNQSFASLSGSTAQTNYPFSYNWASFDGSTNEPVVYPNGTSLQNLNNQVLVQLTPTTLPVGTRNVVYPTTTFVATGGAFSPPFTWSLTGGGGLPAGLTLSPGGTISGTPTQTGTFDFTLQLTDSLARTVTWSYAITIN